MVEKVAQKLAEFHRLAETNEEISTYGSLKAIKVNTEENFSQTEKYIGKTISNEKYERITKFTNSFMEENEGLFNERVAGGRIRIATATYTPLIFVLPMGFVFTIVSSSTTVFAIVMSLRRLLFWRWILTITVVPIFHVALSITYIASS